MDHTVYREFVRCMAAFLHGDSAALTIEDAQWKALLSLARRQSLSGALFAGVKRAAMPSAVFARLQKEAFLTLTSYEAQERVLALLRQTLEAANVPFVLLKGAIIRAYYPDPTMRSMGDIDAAIPEKARKDADRALTAAGFVCETRSPEEWTYRKDGVCVEMHSTVLYYDAAAQRPVPYATLWDDAAVGEGCERTLSVEAHAAYILAHLAAHFANGGCGLRQVMDVAICAAHDPDEAVWQAVLTRLAPFGLDGFARRLLWVCGQWFAVAVPPSCVTPLNEEEEAFLLSRLLRDGTFGADERRLLAAMRRERRLHTHGGVWRRLFPPAEELRRRYAYAKYPLLLPVACGHRLVEGVTKNRRLHRRRLQYAREQLDALAYEVTMYEKLGL